MKNLEIKPIVKNNDHTKLVLAQNKKILLGQGDFQVVAQGEFMGEWYCRVQLIYLCMEESEVRP